MGPEPACVVGNLNLRSGCRWKLVLLVPVGLVDLSRLSLGVILEAFRGTQMQLNMDVDLEVEYLK
jgi:hypothetical protein